MISNKLIRSFHGNSSVVMFEWHVTKEYFIQFKIRETKVSIAGNKLNVQGLLYLMMRANNPFLSVDVYIYI